MSDAEPVNHNIVSSMATAGAGAAQGALAGVTLFAALGAALFVAAAVVVTSTFTALAPVAAPLTIAAGIIGLAAGGSYGFTYGMVGGGLLGLASGAGKVSRESEAFAVKKGRVMNAMQSTEQKVGDQFVQEYAPVYYQTGLGDGLARGRREGFEAGAQYVMAQVDQHMQQQAAMAATAQPKGPGVIPDAGKEKPSAPDKGGEAKVASADVTAPRNSKLDPENFAKTGKAGGYIAQAELDKKAAAENFCSKA